MKNRNTQKLIAFLGLVIINLTVFAQQVPLIDHQYFKPFIANPATTGLENPGAFLLARYQWVDVEGAPRTFVGAFDGSFGEKKIGLGLLASSDRSNILERNGITASYRYGLRIKDDQKLHFGLALGLQASNLNFDQINSPTPAEITLIQNVESFKALDLGFGLNYELKDISLRFGAQQLFRNTHTFEDEIRRLTYSFNYREHGHLALLYRIKATDKVKVIPQAILRADKNLNTQFEALATLNYNESLNIGLRYRQDFGMSFYASALTHDYLWLGYSYSHSTGPVSNLSKRSHEIMIAVKTEKLANRIKDSDFDGVPDSEDQEKFSPLGAPVDSVGVALDSDNDGVVDGRDMELHSRPDCQVDKWGVVLDGDRDSVPDCIDQEPHTPIGAEVDSVGRAIDSDNDQVIDLYDMEPFTPHWKHVHSDPNTDASQCIVNERGVAKDDNFNGIPDCIDTASSKPEIRPKKPKSENIVKGEKTAIDSMENNSGEYNYYVVIGVFRVKENLWGYQQRLLQKYKLNTSIMRPDNEFYYVIHRQVFNREEARKEFEMLESVKVEEYIVGNPWLWRVQKTEIEE